MQLRFKDSQHEKFFLDCMAHSKRDDSYHRAIFYTLGINPDTRANIQRYLILKMTESNQKD